eukprot:5706262-Heterocapsa_arctica.AAC.1
MDRIPGSLTGGFTTSGRTRQNSLSNWLSSTPQKRSGKRRPKAEGTWMGYKARWIGPSPGR